MVLVGPKLLEHSIRPFSSEANRAPARYARPLRTFTISTTGARVLNRHNDLFGSPAHHLSTESRAADRGAVDPMSVMMEGGAVSAAAVGLARRRPRRHGSRREPIDVAAGSPAELAEPRRRAREQEIHRGARAEAEPVQTADLPAPEVDAEADDPGAPSPTLEARARAGRGDPFRDRSPTVARTDDPPGAPHSRARARAPARTGARVVGTGEGRPPQGAGPVEYLQFEQTRLQSQHHLVAELSCSTTRSDQPSSPHASIDGEPPADLDRARCVRSTSNTHARELQVGRRAPA